LEHCSLTAQSSKSWLLTVKHGSFFDVCSAEL